MKKPLFVSKPVLPSYSDIESDLKKILKSSIVTNGGPYNKKFCESLKEFLNVENLSLVNNATSGLLLALKALDIKGDVITTPFSFIATSSVLSWLDLNPIFIDINPQTMNLDENKIEQSITERTSAILAVHCYGNHNNFEVINKIAFKYNLKVIYDAAHAFGINCDCKKMFLHGDASVISFHATKVFNSIEGGCVITRSKKLLTKIDLLKNFGIKNEEKITQLGINCKLDEINSLIGMKNLKSINKNIKKRKRIFDIYNNFFKTIDGISLVQSNNKSPNYSYAPILVEKSYFLSRDNLIKKFNKNGIFPRKYFYPLISNLKFYKFNKSANKKNLPIANDISNRIITLPIYPTMTNDDVNRVLSIFK